MVDHNQFRYFDDEDSNETDNCNSCNSDPCTQGEIMDFLVNEGIVEYDSPSITVEAQHIDSRDMEKIQELGWTAEMYDENGETLLTIHQQ